jgi:hypothetical protein
MVRQRLTEETRFGSGVRIEDHVENPRGDAPSEDVRPIGEMGTHSEDENVDEAFGKLSVVEGSHSGNESQNSS